VFDLYFGKAPELSLIAKDLNQKNLIVTQNLDYETLYIWKVIAKDTEGAETEGPLWGFTTAYGDIFGKVKASEDNSVIANAKIILWGGFPFRAHVTESDDAGIFAFKNLSSAGRYYLLAHGSSYRAKMVIISYDGVNPLELEPIELRRRWFK
jgi:hypothetical protein